MCCAMYHQRTSLSQAIVTGYQTNTHSLICFCIHVYLCSHSFGATENYFVLLEQPFCFNLPKIMKDTLLNKPTIPDKMFEWQENELVCMSEL